MGLSLITKCNTRPHSRLLGLDCHLTGRNLAREDILGGREDGGPILEGGVGHSSAFTEGDQICDSVSIGMIDMSFFEQGQLYLSLPWRTRG